METEDAKSRLRRLLGDEGLTKLENSYVWVIGLGGVGSSCAEALVRGGIGKFLFVDKDIVEPSNINRQAIAFMSTVGRRKTDVMRAMALDINPDAQIDTLYSFVLEENACELLKPFGCPDIIVDAVDTLTAKAAIAKYAAERAIPVISSMGMANRTDPSALRFSQLADTQGCPFCREMRKICRDREIPSFEVLYSTERPIKVKPEEGVARRERTELGTYSYMPPIAGQMIAAYVIQFLLNN